MKTITISFISNLILFFLRFEPNKINLNIKVQTKMHKLSLILFFVLLSSSAFQFMSINEEETKLSIQRRDDEKKVDDSDLDPLDLKEFEEKKQSGGESKKEEEKDDDDDEKKEKGDEENKKPVSESDKPEKEKEEEEEEGRRRKRRRKQR